MLTKFFQDMLYPAINLKVGRIVLPAFLFLILSIISLISCDPPADEFRLGGAFQIKAKILNSRDSLKLGDSLKIVFEIPDTIFLKGFPYNVNDSAKQIILTDKTYCEPGEELAIADSTIAGGTTNQYANNWWAVYANPGYFINNHIRLVKVGNKLLANYYLIPKVKGVFYIASGALGGYFEGNSTSGKIKCRVVFDFDVADRHHNLLQPAIGVNNNLTPMINSMAARGQGLYVFAVK